MGLSHIHNESDDMNNRIRAGIIQHPGNLCYRSQCVKIGADGNSEDT